MYQLQEKVQRDTNDIIILSEEEQLFRKKFMVDNLETSEWKCTVCAKITNDKVFPHPALRVSVCFECLNSYQTSVFLTNKDGTDKNCRWCTKPAKKYSCSSCTVIFCKSCLQRNFDDNFVRNRVIGNSSWNCFICDPKHLWKLRFECFRAMQDSERNDETIEDIDLSSQDSEGDRMTCSQLALVNSETPLDSGQLSEIISPKKTPKPISESDDENEFVSQCTTNDSGEELSSTEKKSLFAVYEECEKDLKEFSALLIKRIEQFSEKYKKVTNKPQASKVSRQLDMFHGKVIENLQFMKNTSQKRIKDWQEQIQKNSVNYDEPKKVVKVAETHPKSKINFEKPSTSKVNHQEETPVSNIDKNKAMISKIDAKSPLSIIDKNRSSVSKIDEVKNKNKSSASKIDNNMDKNQPSTSKINEKKFSVSQIHKNESTVKVDVEEKISIVKKNKPATSKMKGKFNLSLKSPNKVHNTDKIVAHLEKIEKTLPPDEKPLNKFTESILGRINNLEARQKKKTIINNNYKEPYENSSKDQNEVAVRKNEELNNLNHIEETDLLFVENQESFEVAEQEDIIELTSVQDEVSLEQNEVSLVEKENLDPNKSLASLSDTDSAIPLPENQIVDKECGERVPSPPPRRNVAKKHTGPRKSKKEESNKQPEIESSELQETEIKTEPAEDRLSAFSNVTIARSKQNENESSGQENLLARIQEDFKQELDDKTDKDSNMTEDYDIEDLSQYNLEIEIPNEAKKFDLILVEVKPEIPETVPLDPNTTPLFETNQNLLTRTMEEVKEDEILEENSVLSDNSSEYQREKAFNELNDDISDISDIIISDCETSGAESTSSDEEPVDRLRQPWEPTTSFEDYMNIDEEIAKIHQNLQKAEKGAEEPNSPENKIVSSEKSNSSSSLSSLSSSDSEDEKNNDPKLNMRVEVKLGNKDPKFDLEPIVVLEKIDFDNCYGLVRESERRFKVNSKQFDEENEIRRLTNLNLLEKRKIIESSTDDDDTDISESSVGQKKKRFKRISSSSSKSYSSDNDSDSDFKSISSNSYVSSLDIYSSKNDKNCISDVSDLLDDDEILSDPTDDSDLEIEKKKNKERKKKENKNDEKDIENKIEDPKASWRKDKLLTGRLSLSRHNSSDTDTTNDSTANEILQKAEEKYLQTIDEKKSVNNLFEPKVISSDSDSDSNDAIVLSTDIDSDSDVQIVDSKRKRDSGEEEDKEEGEGTPKKNKKGRRNIREVLKDSELDAETQRADKEETQRKERLSLKQKTLEHYLSESQLSQEEVGLVLEFDEETKQPLITIHHKLVTPLKEHQKQGIKFMWDVCCESLSELKKSNGVGCILAHCMGLGKTMQVVVLAHTLLTHPEANIKHVLIVCPLSTVFNWRHEFEQTLKSCPKKISIFDIRPDLQKTFTRKMFEVKRWKSEGGALIMGYESFQALVNEDKLDKMNESYKKIMLESLIDPGPDLVICDEGHMLKNGKTVRFTSLSKVRTKRRIILTGTPLQNNLIEYYHMVNFVKPHLLGTLQEYKNRFVNPIVNGQYEDSSREDINLMKKRSHILHKKLETTVQRFEESELTQYLPAKHDYVLFFQLTPLQILLYEYYLHSLDAKRKKLFKNYHALQNIWTHPGLLKLKFDKRKEPSKKKEKRYDEDYVKALDPDSEDSALDLDWFKDFLPDDVLTNFSYGVKMEALFSVIEECGAVDDKLLVFSSSIDELDLIERFLEQRQGESWVKGKDYYRMDGTVAPEKRMKYCNEFNNENNKVARLFLVSHKVGGLGLNFTAANRVILMDVSWNPAYDVQSVFRVYRFGQKKDCYIYRFVSMGTMEEVVYSRAVTKLAISCRVVDEHQIKRHFNEDDLQRMYRLIKDFDEAPTPTLPSDRLLAKLWEIHKPKLYKFCDHQSLLENLTNEELNEEEIRVAWEEFRNEENRAKEMVARERQQPNSYVLNIPQPSTSNGPGSYPGFSIDMAAANQKYNPNHRFRQPNPLPPVPTTPIPPSQEYRHHSEYVRDLIRYNANNSASSTSKSNHIPLSTSNGNATSFPSNQNYTFVAPGVRVKSSKSTPMDLSLPSRNPAYYQNNTTYVPLGRNHVPNTSERTMYTNPFSYKVPNRKTVAPKTTQNGQINNVQSYNNIQRSFETLAHNGVSVIPQTNQSNNDIENGFFEP